MSASRAIFAGGALALQQGRAVAKPRGGDRHSGRIEAHGSFIKELLAEQGDITLSKVSPRPKEELLKLSKAFSVHQNLQILLYWSGRRAFREQKVEARSANNRPAPRSADKFVYKSGPT